MSGASAADSERFADAQARYERERAACQSGASIQDRETCLREAGAALAEARRGTLKSETDNYALNALQRCRAQPIEAREACVARLTGQAQVTGSVEEGGFVREHRELIIGVPQPATPTPPSPERREEPAQIIIIR